jgi:hypothetical protein
MSYVSCQAIFRSSMRERETSYPFAQISAYKVRESRDNLQRECAVVASIAEYLRARPSDRRGSTLLGCTEEDKAHRLKRTPHIIARELGYNLIPAIEALTLEGIPREDIDAFLATIKPRVQQLVSDCDAARTAISRSIQGEYARMKAGNSDLMRICNEALDIADLAVEFCERHRVL